jgi:hypothetical protein
VAYFNPHPRRMQQPAGAGLESISSLFLRLRFCLILRCLRLNIAVSHRVVSRALVFDGRCYVKRSMEFAEGGIGLLNHPIKLSNEIAAGFASDPDSIHPRQNFVTWCGRFCGSRRYSHTEVHCSAHQVELCYKLMLMFMLTDTRENKWLKSLPANIRGLLACWKGFSTKVVVLVLHSVDRGASVTATAVSVMSNRSAKNPPNKTNVLT